MEVGTGLLVSPAGEERVGDLSDERSQALRARQRATTPRMLTFRR